MRLENIDYINKCYGISDTPGFSQKASYSKKENLKKGLYFTGVVIALYGFYDSIYQVKRDYYAIIHDGITRKRVIVKEEGWHFKKPFIDKIIIAHERYGNTTLEGMLDELMDIKKAREATQSYHVVVMNDKDLEREIETISPYIGRHFTFVIKPNIKFEEEIKDPIGGLYNPEKNLVLINKEYAEGQPRGNDSIVYHIIAHEDVHAQGISNETSTEVISAEVCAEAASDFKRYEATTFRWLEQRLFEASYLRAKEEDRLAYWLIRIERIYKGMLPFHLRYFEKIPTEDLEKYALLPYVKIKLAMAEDNIVYELPDYDIGKNPEGGYFKIDDLSKLLEKGRSDILSLGSLQTNLLFHLFVDVFRKNSNELNEN